LIRRPRILQLTHLQMGGSGFPRAALFLFFFHCELFVE
jgi:hypothetical protein